MLDPKYDPRFVQAAEARVKGNIISKNAPGKPWRIRYNGEFIQGDSGSLRWSHKGHAKNALNNMLRYVSPPGWNYSSGPRPNGRELANHLLEEGIVEIVKE